MGRRCRVRQCSGKAFCSQHVTSSLLAPPLPVHKKSRAGGVNEGKQSGCAYQLSLGVVLGHQGPQLVFLAGQNTEDALGNPAYAGRGVELPCLGELLGAQLAAGAGLGRAKGAKAVPEDTEGERLSNVSVAMRNNNLGLAIFVPG